MSFGLSIFIKKNRCNIFNCTLLFILLSTLSCCSKQEDLKDTSYLPDSTINYPPLEFTVQVLDVSYNHAIIEWSPAIDPNQDTILYSVVLNDSLFVSDTTVDMIYRFNNLTPETYYSGEVYATDSKSEPISIPFSFTTSKYFITFDKIYSSTNRYYGYGMSIEYAYDNGYMLLSTISGFDDGADRIIVFKIDSLGYEEWHKIYDLNASEYIGGIIRKTNTGGFIITIGRLILKIDQFGDVLWYDEHPTEQGHFNSVIQTKNDNYLAPSSSTWNDEKQITQATIHKYSDTGEIIWSKILDTEKNTQGVSICATDDENFILFGAIWEENKYRFWTAKLSIDGEIIWEKDYDTQYYDFVFPYKISPTDDNGFILCGDGLGDRDISYARVVKIQENGDLEWERVFHMDSFKTHAYSIVCDNDGGYTFVGGNGYDPEECILVKLKQDGSNNWVKHIKPDDCGDYQWIGRDLLKTWDDGYVVSGIKYWVWNGCESYERGTWLFRTNEYGNFSN